MAFNGSGTFNRLYSWVNDAANGIKIRADRMDNEMNGMAVGLSTCLTKDGQTTVTANLPMANFRHTGVGNAASRTDYASFGQVQDGKAAWADAGGTADAITASYSIPVTALVDGQLCFVRALAANATTTPTFSPNGLTARTIVKNGGAALAAGDIAGDGHELVLRYDLTNTRWELLNPRQPIVPNIPYVAASAAGPSTLDFFEDTDNGTNKVTLRGPTSIGSDSTLQLPSTGTLATLAGTETLSGKTVFTVASTTASSAFRLPHGSAPTTPTDGDIWSETGGFFGRANGVTKKLDGSTLAALQNTSSGSVVDFAGIPPNVSQIKVMFNGVSVSGTDSILVQLGDSGGIESTGYVGSGQRIAGSVTVETDFTNAFGLFAGDPSIAVRGILHLDLMDAATNTWVASGVFARGGVTCMLLTGGTKSLSSILDRLRITVTGANTFDGGSVSIKYE